MSKYTFENIKKVVYSSDFKGLFDLDEAGLSGFYVVVKQRFESKDERFVDLYEKIIISLRRAGSLLSAFNLNLCPADYEGALMLAVDDLGSAADQVAILAAAPEAMRVVKFMQPKTFANIYRETDGLDALLRHVVAEGSFLHDNSSLVFCLENSGFREICRKVKELRVKYAKNPPIPTEKSDVLNRIDAALRRIYSLESSALEVFNELAIYLFDLRLNESEFRKMFSATGQLGGVFRLLKPLLPYDVFSFSPEEGKKVPGFLLTSVGSLDKSLTYIAQNHPELLMCILQNQLANPYFSSVAYSLDSDTFSTAMDVVDTLSEESRLLILCQKELGLNLLASCLQALNIPAGQMTPRFRDNARRILVSINLLPDNAKANFYLVSGKAWLANSIPILHRFFPEELNSILIYACRHMNEVNVYNTTVIALGRSLLSLPVADVSKYALLLYTGMQLSASGYPSLAKYWCTVVRGLLSVKCGVLSNPYVNQMKRIVPPVLQLAEVFSWLGHYNCERSFYNCVMGWVNAIAQQGDVAAVEEELVGKVCEYKKSGIISFYDAKAQLRALIDNGIFSRDQSGEAEVPAATPEASAQ